MIPREKQKVNDQAEIFYEEFKRKCEIKEKKMQFIKFQQIILIK